jgi:hypothetical protein
MILSSKKMNKLFIIFDLNETGIAYMADCTNAYFLILLGC